MKKRFISSPAAAVILTISLLCTGGIPNTSKAMTTPTANTTAAPSASIAAGNAQVPAKISASPATDSAISTPEPTDMETPNPNEIKVPDILSISKKTLLVQPGQTYTVTYNASATPAVRSSNKKIATVTLKQQKLAISVAPTAAKGSKATITLTLGALKKQLIVTVENKARKIAYSKKRLTIKKGKSKKITVALKSENNSKKTTDTIRITSSKRSVATIKKAKITAGKITFSIQSKQSGSTKIQIKAGNIKKTFSCIVQDKKRTKKIKK